MKKNEIQVGFQGSEDNYLALFDEQFTVSVFETTFQKSEKDSENIISCTINAIKKEIDQLDSSPEYIVDMDEDVKEAIRRGDVALVKTEDGEILAKLRGKDGKFFKSLPIKERLEESGITADAVEMAIQIEAIKKQLHIILEGIKGLEEQLAHVLQGQQNDRIGLYYSGLSLYIEAKTINDPQLKRSITSQALKAISDSNYQMIQEIRTSIEYLISGKYQNSKKPTDQINQHLTSIHQCYDVICRSFFLKATIYQENNELKAMLTTIDEYGRFIEKMIVPYSGKLSELDKNEKFIEKGTWGIIAKSLCLCGELRKQLSEREIYYLSLEGEQNAS